ncbi:hypothetical protein [Moorena sp. SIO3H5]|nr:hypothetical protein [Moorena sp. SIO3H5]NEO72082.1 hypothetical protein [Moorena sp. SIO3H5]
MEWASCVELASCQFQYILASCQFHFQAARMPTLLLLSAKTEVEGNLI